MTQNIKGSAPTATPSPASTKPALAPQQPASDAASRPVAETPTEIGGPTGPEPTRFGDWERGGRCSDF